MVKYTRTLPEYERLFAMQSVLGHLLILPSYR